jgi:rod shape-determining protein MreC
LRSAFGALWQRIALAVFVLVSGGLIVVTASYSDREGSDALGYKEWPVLETARDTVTELVMPVYELAAAPLRWVEAKGEEAQDFFSVYEENKRLREENARLLAWQQSALSLEQRLVRYEELLNVQPEPGVSSVTARVVMDESGPFLRAFVVNAGVNQGVKKGQAAIDGQGLLGRVISAGQNSSRVLRLEDLNSRIPVQVEPTGTKAILTGDNSDQPRLEYLPPMASVSAGDRVVTSGDGGLLPPGLPVGTITGEDGDYRVTLFSDYRRTEYARLLQYDFPRTVDTPETGELVSQDGTSTNPAVPAPPSLH